MTSELYRFYPIESEFVNTFEHRDELIAKAVLEGDAPCVEITRYEYDLFVFDVDTLYVTDALGEAECLWLRKWSGCEVAPVVFVEKGWI